MKKIFALFIILLGLIGFNQHAFAEDDIKIILNDEEISFDVSPEIVNGRTMVPMRKIFEALGVEVSWDDETQTALGVKEIIQVKFALNEDTYSVCGIPFESENAVYLKDGNTMIPLRAVAECLGANVEWDAVNHIVLIRENEMNYEEGDNYKLYAEFQNSKCNGFGVILFNSGLAYVGELKNGLYRGSGAQSTDNGYYIGEFVDGKRDGYGKYVWNNGGYYIGDWVDNERTGYGTYYKTNGDYYKTTWNNNVITGNEIEYHYANGCCYLITSKKRATLKLEGNGVYYDTTGSYRKCEDDDSWSIKNTLFYNDDDSLKNGIDTFRIEEENAVYTGEFVDGCIHGQGELLYDNGEIYHGTFDRGYKTGEATLTMLSGICYIGYVEDGYITSQGKFIDQEGNYYIWDKVLQQDLQIGNYIFYNADGTLKNGHYKVTIHAGEAYEGNFVDGRVSGAGSLYIKDQLFYKGTFVNGLLEGEGELFYEDGRYVGEIKNGKRDGEGILYYYDDKDVASYSGQWVDNIKCGDGVYYYTDGTQSRRTYDESEKLRSSEGKVRYENGDVFIGTIIDYQIQGQGEYHYSNGDVYKGHFVDGKRHGTAICYISDDYYFDSLWENDEPVLNNSTCYYSLNGELINSSWFEFTYGGITYKGKMVDGKYNGICDIIEDGTTRTVRMKNNVIQKNTQSNDSGKWTINSDNYFEGTRVNGEWYNGSGKWTKDSDNYFEGTWVKGYWHNGIGKWTKDSDNYFEGTWVKGYWHDGIGKWTKSSNDYFEGT